jgi:hypothetical protein
VLASATLVATLTSPGSPFALNNSISKGARHSNHQVTATLVLKPLAEIFLDSDSFRFGCCFDNECFRFTAEALKQLSLRIVGWGLNASFHYHLRHQGRSCQSRTYSYQASQFCVKGLCRDFSEFLVQDPSYLIHILDAARCLRDFSVFEIYREWKSSEVAAFREITNQVANRPIELHVSERDVFVLRLQFFHHAIHGDAHRSHAAAADHDVLIPLERVVKFLFGSDVVQICLEHCESSFS